MEQTSQCSALAEIASRSWRPAPAIRASVAFHVSALAAFAFEPVSWPYLGAALAANHAMLAIAGMWPRSALLGPNITRLPQHAIERREIALTFDDGPNPSVTPRVLDVLDCYNVKASFFCVGERAGAHPALLRDIAGRGHSIENHTHTHPSAFAAYGISRLRREIESAQYTIASICGRAPAFFRAPIGIRNPLLDPVLAKLGLNYVSWTRRGFDTVHPDAAAVCERLGQNLSAG